MSIHALQQINGYFQKAHDQVAADLRKHLNDLEQEEQREKYLDMLREDFEQALGCLDLSGSEKSRNEAATKIEAIAEYVRRGAEA